MPKIGLGLGLNSLKFTKQESGIITYNAFIVSGAGTETSNGIYTFSGYEEASNNRYYSGPPGSFNYIETINNNPWILWDEAVGTVTYSPYALSEYPWQLEWYVADGAAPAPTLTPINV